jgi:hypothetical protein
VTYFLHTGFVPVATSEVPGGSAGRYGCAGWSRQREEEDKETIYLHPVAGRQTGNMLLRWVLFFFGGGGGGGDCNTEYRLLVFDGL